MARITIPLNKMPCGVCYRSLNKYTPSTWVAVNSIRKMVLCDKHYHDFKDKDTDEKEAVFTQYFPIDKDLLGTIEEGVMPPLGTNGYYLDHKGTK